MTAKVQNLIGKPSLDKKFSFFLYLCIKVIRSITLHGHTHYMKKVNKVLYISQEIFPYLPESEMSNMGRYLPQAVQDRGRETRTFMPKFGAINERRNQLHEVIRLSGMNLIIDDTDHPLIIKVASIQAARLQVYFIDNEDFFHRKNTTRDDNEKDYTDNDERSIFFIRGVMETVKKLRWTPDVIHCIGWMTALAPLYIKKAYNEDPFFKNAKVIYSLFDESFTQPFNNTFADKLMIEGVEPEDVKNISKKTVDYVSLNKLAIDFADGVIQSTPTSNAKLMKHIKDSGKKFLPYHADEDYADDYVRFYDSVI